jgi:hypothetical protein
VTARHYCPACGAGLVAEPIGTSLHCKNCSWHLISLDAWRKMPPFRQGYLFYSQGSWPTSALANEKNPYAEGTPEQTEFQHGERRAMLAAQDGEE